MFEHLKSAFHLFPGSTGRRLRTDPDRSGARLAKAATLAYMAAISLIAALVIGLYLVVADIVDQQQNASARLEAARWQMTLLQRILLLAADTRAGDSNAKPLLDRAANDLEMNRTTHIAKLKLSEINHTKATDPSLIGVREAIDIQMPDFLASARVIAAGCEPSRIRGSMVPSAQSRREPANPAL